ncbi:MAG: hypothetical protein WA749_08480 [Gelidibacter sp.]
MNFTDYYSRILSIQGDYPKLSFEQHKKMFNIISLEMRLEELNRIENALKDPDLQRKIYQRNQSLRSQLEKLTDNDHAASLLEKMVAISQLD